MTKGSDIELVNACKCGDAAATEHFIDQFQGPIYNAAFRIVGSQHDAQDISQTVFLKIFEHLDDYKPEYRLFSWVYRIAINESINFSKRKREVSQLNEQQLHSADRPDLAIETKELGAQLENALVQLSEDYRAVIVLKHVAGFSYQEISTILELPEKTVRSRLYTARQNLQSILRTAAEPDLQQAD